MAHLIAQDAANASKATRELAAFLRPAHSRGEGKLESDAHTRSMQ